MRVVAPIPGKARVGLEVPNDERQVVTLRAVLESERWSAAGGALPLALGEDATGQPMVVDLAEMPHLLVAGATGAGKSVGLNAMLASLLYRRSPDEMRLVLVDLKMVEFGVYADVPHLLVPVVTDAQPACAALQWAVQEMERRYALLATVGARNLPSYNERVRERMPHLVIVVDEVADLFLAAPKVIEACVGALCDHLRAQVAAIEYLRAENEVLREQLGTRGLRLTDAQRRRLAVKGRSVGSKGSP